MVTIPGAAREKVHASALLSSHGVSGKARRRRGVTAWVRRVAGDFGAAGVPASCAADLLRVRWEKLVWNIPFNGLSVLLDATTRQIVDQPDSLALAAALMREVAGAAGACGRRIGAGYLRRRLDDTRRMAPYRTSMKIDYDRRRPMEVEAIFGNPWRAARRAGYEAGLIQAVYHQLRYLEACRVPAPHRPGAQR